MPPQDEDLLTLRGSTAGLVQDGLDPWSPAARLKRQQYWILLLVCVFFGLAVRRSLSQSWSSRRTSQSGHHRGGHGLVLHVLLADDSLESLPQLVAVRSRVNKAQEAVVGWRDTKQWVVGLLIVVWN